jgi:catechol 2,3-dioxygenase-like lactoylglutathione lyase family enzyme
MGFHHVAIAVSDLAATHRFYTDAMGFRLVHVEAGESGEPSSWFRHVLYDTGDGSLLAFFELHDDRYADLDLGISTGLGLPPWVNHIAYTAVDLDALDLARDRWLASGLDVARMDHGLSISIYTNDPDGNLVEWCCWTAELTDEHAHRAEHLLRDPAPPRNDVPDVEFFLAADFASAHR